LFWHFGHLIDFFIVYKMHLREEVTSLRQVVDALREQAKELRENKKHLEGKQQHNKKENRDSSEWILDRRVY